MAAAPVAAGGVCVPPPDAPEAVIKLRGGDSMPALGLGTWKSAPGDVRAAVVAAVEAGYRHIDAAAAYGNEAEVGAALADVIARGVVRRSDLFVTTKLWVTASHPEEVADALAASLRRLGLEYVDLYLIHWPFFVPRGYTTFPPASPADVIPFSAAAYLAVWAELEAAVDAGKARYIGTSNMTVAKLTAVLPAMRILPAANQVEAHPFLAQAALKAFCDAHGIVLVAYSPLGSPDRPARLIDDADPTPLADATVAAVAAKHHVTPAQVLLRWAVQRGTAAIPKSVTPAHIAANLAVYHFALDADDVAALARLDCGARLIKGHAFMSTGMTAWQQVWDEEA